MDMTELARVAMFTQPRITQVMNLLHLAPNIQEKILFLPNVLAGATRSMRSSCGGSAGSRASPGSGGFGRC